MQDNREYRYLTEDIAEYKRVRAENRVSVNEAEFKKSRTPRKPAVRNVKKNVKQAVKAMPKTT